VKANGCKDASFVRYFSKDQITDIGEYLRDMAADKFLDKMQEICEVKKVLKKI
jgi:hypothetical protein